MVPDPRLDKVVSWHIAKSGLWDAPLTAQISETLQHNLHYHAASRELFVDVGANVGWFGLLAAAHNRSVAAYEPQARLVSLLQASVHLNGWGPPPDDVDEEEQRREEEGRQGRRTRRMKERQQRLFFDVRRSAVTDLREGRRGSVVGLTGTGDRWGGARVVVEDGQQQQQQQPKLSAREWAPAVALDDEVLPLLQRLARRRKEESQHLEEGDDDGEVSCGSGEGGASFLSVTWADIDAAGGHWPVDGHDQPRVALLKVDAEGHELAVMRGARRLLEARGLLSDAVFEFDPRRRRDVQAWEAPLYWMSNICGFETSDVSEGDCMPLIPHARGILLTL